KIFYIKAPSGIGGTPNFQWAVVLTSDSANGKIGLRFSYQNGVASAALYGGDNELGGFKSGVVNGIVQLDYDRWYTVEVQVKRKSGLGAQDSIVRLWVDGVLEFQKSNTWTIAPTPCRVGRPPCPAFPDDAVFNFGIDRIEIGTQTDRVNYDTVE